GVEEHGRWRDSLARRRLFCSGGTPARTAPMPGVASLDARPRAPDRARLLPCPGAEEEGHRRDLAQGAALLDRRPPPVRLLAGRLGGADTQGNRRRREQ